MPRTRTQTGVVYHRLPDRELRLDLHWPGSRSPRATILWLHGGGWRSGSRAECRIRWLATRGYCVASADYRFADDALFPAQLHDVAHAARWLRQRGHDPLIAGGASAGGHLALMLALATRQQEFQLEPGLVDGVINCFAPTDFVRMLSYRTRIRYGVPTAPESRLIGQPVAENPPRGHWASPITYVHPDPPPILSIHGDEDGIVPHDQAQRLHDALLRVGAESRLHIIPHAGHGEPGFFELPEVRKPMLDFLERLTRQRLTPGATGISPSETGISPAIAP